jgi:hypothetical protein
MLEYGYMLHRSLAENSTKTSGSGNVLRLRKDIARLKSQLRQPSPFGEIEDLLEEGWQCMGVQGLREDIAEVLAIAEAEAKIAEARSSESMSKALTILFGLIAVPSIAGEVIRPMWDLLSLWRPANPSTETLFMVFIALIFVSVIIYLISWGISKR